MQIKKILFYSHDTYGLGHLSRILKIGQYIAQHRKNISILIVSGSGIIHKIKIPPGIDYIKVPSVTKIGDDQYKSKYLDIDIEDIITLRQNILLDAALSFKPDVFVIDNVPLGLKNEATLTLENLSKVRPRCKIILTMRDVLDEPAKIKRVWARDGIYEQIEKYFDSVLVFGQQDIYNIIKKYEIPEPTASKFHFCGYLNNAPITISPETLKKNLGVDEHKLILITAGGGGDGDTFIETALKGLHQYNSNKFKIIIILGPDFPKHSEENVRSLYGKNNQFIIKNFVENLPDFINASDLVITMGGYNTICEILTFNKKAIVIPRITPRVEQLIRAKLLSKYGLLEYIHPKSLNTKILLHKIGTLLYTDQSVKNAIHLDGLKNAMNTFDKILAV